MASNTLASLSSPSTNVWMDTGVTLPKSHFFLWASTSDCLTTDSRILTEWKSSPLNRAVCGVILNVRIGKDFGLKNSVFYIRTALTENDRFLCIFSFNEYFTAVTGVCVCVCVCVCLLMIKTRHIDYSYRLCLKYLTYSITQSYIEYISLWTR